MAFTKDPKGPNLELRRARQRAYQVTHRDEIRARLKVWRQTHREEIAAYRLKIKDKLPEYRRRYRGRYVDLMRASDLRRLYSLTPELYAQMLRHQHNACAICRREFDGKKPFSVPCVDHEHGADVRGILCGKCNRALGGFRDDPEILAAAIAYLASPPAAAFLTPQLRLFEMPA